MQGGAGADTLDGGAGTADAVSYVGAGAAVSINLSSGSHTGDASGDVLTGFELYVGTAFADTITGSAATEWYMGGASADQFTGGGGLDEIWYVQSGAAVSIDLSTGSASGGDAAGDTFTGIAGVRGSIYADSLVGNSSANTLYGEGGDDTILAGDGDDTIQLHTDAGAYTPGPVGYVAYVDGGAGNDTILQGTEDAGSEIHGGTGNDRIMIWNGGSFGGDGNDTFTAPGSGDMYGEAGSDMFIFQGGLNYANGGDGADTYQGIALGISFAEETGATGTDVVLIPYAATSSQLYMFYDNVLDRMYFTSTADAGDGTINWGVAVLNWSTSGIDRLMANDGSFLSV